MSHYVCGTLLWQQQETNPAPYSSLNAPFSHAPAHMELRTHLTPNSHLVGGHIQLVRVLSGVLIHFFQNQVRETSERLPWPFSLPRFDLVSTARAKQWHLLGVHCKKKSWERTISWTILRKHNQYYLCFQPSQNSSTKLRQLKYILKKPGIRMSRATCPWSDTWRKHLCGSIQLFKEPLRVPLSVSLYPLLQLPWTIFGASYRPSAKTVHICTENFAYNY